MSTANLLAVSAAAPDDYANATLLAAALNAPVFSDGELPLSASTQLNEYLAVLVVDGKKLALVQTGKGAPGPVSVDFGSATMRHRRRGGANELLGRAVGVGKKECLAVLDATAGLGRDAFVLADLGCGVQLCERQPVIAALLSAGIACAADAGDAWLAAVVTRMKLWEGDARDFSAEGMCAMDVIYLDPMFGARGKTAAVKKEMAIFQRLLSDTAAQGDSEALLDWALAQDVARVVVKRPLKSEPLAALKPSHAIRGKAVRYDVHVLRKL